MTNPFSYYKFPKAMRIIAMVFGVLLLLTGVLSVTVWIDPFDSVLLGILVGLVLTGGLVYIFFDAAFSKVKFDGTSLSWNYVFPRVIRIQDISEISTVLRRRYHFMDEGIFIVRDSGGKRRFIRVYHLGVIGALEQLAESGLEKPHQR